MNQPLWLPNVVRKEIPRGSNDPFIIPAGDVFHVAVSEAASLHDFFNGPSGGIESTGYIRRDGTIEQYRPLNVECDAQGDGNSWLEGSKRYGFNSWETQGMGDGEWTPEQLASIKRIIAWKHTHYGIPLRKPPVWNAHGFGYHCLHAQWNHNAHSCPGPDRVKQFNHIIVPWMNQGGSEELDMNEKQLQEAIASTPITIKVGAEQKEKNWRLDTVLQHLENEQDAIKRKLDDILTAVKGK